MRFIKPYQLKTIIVLSLLWLYGCTFTQTYQPEFNGKKTATIDSIKTKYGFEDVSFSAKKISKSGEKQTSLTVKFINGKTIPADTAQMATLEKLLGSQIKTIVKNPKEFDSYIILFDKVTVNGNATNEDYTGREFKSGDL
ncbi:hypothetical protein JN11_00892 [Mucilaginibacter frigoritolerans]|uniref:Lipoprotein n=1 Tax=Mucilaginibacter frigoritolerans TaxID=652788 RepID=A0A562UC16_9SPHI|nr:hypothetical protein [Mucilaginibacter frigoritolerans]TWJ03354.1 hypothetical protein JN11_00892 [Mucilaginibacter frigoritolerans]